MNNCIFFLSRFINFGELKRYSHNMLRGEIEEVAMNAFGHADDVDRAGNADKKTAMAFNTSATLLQVLQGARGDSFSDELEQKKKYALFKTTDILKCLKQGIRPQPGPPGGEEEDVNFCRFNTHNVSESSKHMFSV